jgi:hypothetical protein
MADIIPRSMPATLARRLHALAERRCAHFADLQSSGRWAHYYASQDQFMARMREVQALARISQSMVHKAEQNASPPARSRRLNVS